MAIINPYTSGSENATEPVKVPANLSTLPGTRFLVKRKKLADKSLGFAAKCKLAVPGSKWNTGNNSPVNTVTIDYVTGFGDCLFVSFTDSEGNPTGYTAIGSFLSRYPLPVEVKRQQSKRAEPAELESTTGERKLTAIDLGAIV